MVLPLDGITVLDFSTLLPGPLASFMLAEAGARVIKVERPGGEDMRGFPPHHGTMSAPFLVLNGGKEFIVADLKNVEDRERLLPLIRSADVVLEQFRPGVMARLGLGPDDLRSVNPRLIYCSITGYGQTGPRAVEAGHDLNYQAVTGLLSLSPGTPGAPTVPPALTADIAGGAMPAVMNILLALRQREQTGEGCHIDIAMADAMFTFSWLALAGAHASGRFPGSQDTLLTGGSPRYRLYATRDGKFLAVGALEEKFWRTFCEAIGLEPELWDDGRDPDATFAAVAAIIGSQDAMTWASRIEPLDCCCTIVRSLEEARADPHFTSRGLFDALAVGPDGMQLPSATVPIAPALRRSASVLREVREPGTDSF